MLRLMRGENRRDLGGVPRGSSGAGLTLSARILFVDFGDSSITLDCLAYSDLTEAPHSSAWRAGIPFTMELALPATNWMPLARVAMERWADESVEIEVEMTRRVMGPRVRLGDGATYMTLEPLVH